MTEGIALDTLFDPAVLDGRGEVGIRGDHSRLAVLLASQAPFSEADIDEVVVMDLRAATGRALRLGDRATLALGIEAGGTLGASLDVIRSDDAPGMELLASLGLTSYLTEETLYLAFSTDAHATAGADLAPEGLQHGLSGSFGIEAGGLIHFTALRPIPAGQAAGEALTSFFRWLRLPHQIDRVEFVPRPGEVLRLVYGGYLRAGVDLAWGYAISRTAGVSLADLDLKETIYLEAEARLGLSFDLAGHFDVEVRRAREDDPAWARVTVRKARTRAFEFAADVQVGAALETEGRPDTPGAFLEGVLGLRVTDVLRQIDTALATFATADPAAFFDALKAGVDGLTARVIERFTERVLGRPLDALMSSEASQTLHSRLVEVKALHDALGPKVVGYMEDRLGQLDVGRLINRLKATTNGLVDPAGLQAITDPEVWRLLEVLTDVEWIDVVTNTAGAFDRLKEKLALLEREGLERLAAFIEARRAALHLEELLDALVGIDPAALNDQANAHLQTLMARLTGIGAEKLKTLTAAEVGTLQQKVRRMQAARADFAKDLYAQFGKALNRSYELSLAYRYRFASAGEALVEVEVNLAAPGGAMRMRQAVLGDFRTLTKQATPDQVVLHRGVLTHYTERAHTLQVNLFGWEAARTEVLLTRVEEVLEQKDDGVLHVYGIEAESRAGRRRRGEETEQVLAFKVLAEGFQAAGAERAIDAVKAMSSDYALRIADDRTTRPELRRYLAFADDLGLLPDGYAGQVVGLDSAGDLRTARIDGYLAEIAEELEISPGEGFGTVAVRYRLRYEAAALLDVFRANISLERHARQTLRTVAAVAYAAFPPFRGLAEAYLEPAMQRVWERDGLSTQRPGPLVYTIQHGGSQHRITLSNHERRNLDRLYDIENRFVAELLALDAVMDAAAAGQRPDADALAERLAQFTRLQAELNKWIGFGDRAVVPPFLAVLNRLTTVATRRRKTWTTTLELCFNVEVAGEARTVKKLLVG